MILFIIFFILLILGLKFNNKFIFYLQGIFIILFIAGNNLNPDYLAYRYDFFHSDILIKNIKIFNLFYYLNFLGKKLTLKYEEFLLITTIFLIIVMYRTISKYSKNKTFVISLFMLYPLIDNLIQRKNFIGMVIILYSIKYLEKENKKNLLKYYTLVILAILIHPINIVFLIFPFVKKLKKIKWILIVILFILFFISGNILENELMEIGLKLGKNYNYEKLSFIKALGIGIWQVTGILFIKLSKPKNRKEKLVYEMNCLSLCLIPLYSIITINLIRINRNLLLYNYIIISNCNSKNIKRLYLIYIFSSYIFFYFYSLEEFKYIYTENIFINILLNK